MALLKISEVCEIFYYQSLLAFRNLIFARVIILHFQMEVVYSKLYDKYTRLKANKFAEMDEVNKAQEEKFVHCVSVAEELMEFLKKENDDLRNENIQLRKEMASMGASMDEKLAEYQELLMEGDRKNKELSIEIVKLQNLQPEGFHDKNQHLSSGIKSRKRGRIDVVEEESMLAPAIHQEAEPVAVISVDSMSSGDPEKTLQLERPRRTIGSTGAGAFEDDPAHNLCQFFAECLLGMKISTISQREGMIISALHESSGYSISMKTVNFGGREEAELFIRVVSLGTFERAAPECMKEDIILSKTMIPIFFEKVSSVINKNF